MLRAHQPTMLIPVDELGHRLLERAGEWLPPRGETARSRVGWCPQLAEASDIHADPWLDVLLASSQREGERVTPRLIVAGTPGCGPAERLTAHLTAFTDDDRYRRLCADQTPEVWWVAIAETIDAIDIASAARAAKTLCVPSVVTGVARDRDQVELEAATLIQFLATDLTPRAGEQLARGLGDHRVAEAHIEFISDGTDALRLHALVEAGRARVEILRRGEPAPDADAVPQDPSPWADLLAPWMTRRPPPPDWSALVDRAAGLSDQALRREIRARLTLVDGPARAPMPSADAMAEAWEQQVRNMVPKMEIERHLTALIDPDQDLHTHAADELRRLAQMDRGLAHGIQEADRCRGALDRLQPPAPSGPSAHGHVRTGPVVARLEEARARLAAAPPRHLPAWTTPVAAVLALTLAVPLWDAGLALAPASGTRWATAGAADRVRMVLAVALSMPWVGLVAGALVAMGRAILVRWRRRIRDEISATWSGPLSRPAAAIAAAWGGEAGPAPRLRAAAEDALMEQTDRLKRVHLARLDALLARANHAARDLDWLTRRLDTLRPGHRDPAPERSSFSREPRSVRHQIRHPAEAVPQIRSPGHPGWQRPPLVLLDDPQRDPTDLDPLRAIDDLLLWEERFLEALDVEAADANIDLTDIEIGVPGAGVGDDELALTRWFGDQRLLDCRDPDDLAGEEVVFEPPLGRMWRLDLVPRTPPPDAARPTPATEGDAGSADPAAPPAEASAP